MKAYKKIISFILTLVMMLSLSVNVFAAEPLTDDPNMIEWKYTVFADESLQKVVEEGVIPNAYARYTWRGITLKNGEVAILTPSNNSMGLYCNSGRYMEKALEILEKYRLVGKTAVYFSPVFGRIQPVEIVDFLMEKKLNDVKLQIQLHKVIWDPQKRGV